MYLGKRDNISLEVTRIPHSNWRADRGCEASHASSNFTILDLSMRSANQTTHNTTT
jgi:hypothetical protein